MVETVRNNSNEKIGRVKMRTAIQSKSPGPLFGGDPKVQFTNCILYKIVKRTTGQADLLPPPQPRRYLLSSLHQLASTSVIPIVKKGRQVGIYQYSGSMAVAVLW